MILYGSLTSPFVRHARIALAESGLSHEFIVTDTNEAAKTSPMMRLPYLKNGDLMLTDSAVIIRYVREQAGMPYLATIKEHETFCTASTILDSAISLMLMASVLGIQADNTTEVALKPGSGNFANRQLARVEAGVDQLEKYALANELPGDSIAGADAAIRVACLLSWGLFRNAFTLDKRPGLAAFLKSAETYTRFAETAPKE